MSDVHLLGDVGTRKIDLDPEFFAALESRHGILQQKFALLVQPFFRQLHGDETYRCHRDALKHAVGRNLLRDPLPDVAALLHVGEHLPVALVPHGKIFDQTTVYTTIIYVIDRSRKTPYTVSVPRMNPGPLVDVLYRTIVLPGHLLTYTSVKY